MTTPLEVEYAEASTLRILEDGTRILAGRSAAGRAVTIKVLPLEHAARLEEERLRNEYEIGRRVEGAGALKPLALGTWNGRPAIVLESFVGEPLDAMLDGRMPTLRFLELAIRITRALADLHKAGVVHRDVKPPNIVVGAEEVKLAGLGIASQLPGNAGIDGALVEGTLAYMSPEQTGRMSRPVDQRSDLYSLGVTFFQMLGGQLPFDARDAREWIHCHIARTPPQLCAIAPAVPDVVGSIVMKLLAKATDERYQSARGLLRDLEECLERFPPDGTILPFVIGAHDAPERFQIPQQLYGRELELVALEAAFARVAAGGGPHLVLVRGGAGSGKSRLVREVEQEILGAGGSFLAGKFDQGKPNAPYATFVEAFREIVLEGLTQDDHRLAALRGRLLAALGPNARLVSDVIPELELVVGRQPVVVELAPAESQNRFHLALRQFIAVFAEERPLTIFLDDLQWADAASLALLEDLLVQPDMRRILVIGAYRDGEVDAAHPLAAALGRLARAGIEAPTVTLGPLSPTDLGRLIANTLRCSQESARPLAAIVHENTDGNPFFAVQFLTALHDEHLIELDDAAAVFRWDVGRIRARSFSDNVVDLMVAKLRRRDAATRIALEQLACIGSRADLAVLARVHGQTEKETEAVLRPAVAAGLVNVAGDTYQFVHDRVQEAAYSLVSESTRPSIHLRIGRVLAEEDSGDAGGRIFEIVNHKNRGADLIEDPAERAALATLNYRAGLRAKAAVAYASAQTYFQLAGVLLAEDAWTTDFADTFALHLARAECEFMIDQREDASATFDLLLDRAQSNVDRVKIWILRMRLCQLDGHPEDAIVVMLDALRVMNVGVPSLDSALGAMVEESRKVSVNLRGRRVADLVDAPLATDPEVRALISLYVTAMPCTNIAQPELFPLFVLRAINLALEHGNTDDACFAYGAYGCILVGVFSDIPTAFAYAEMAIRLNEKLGDARLRGVVLYLYAGFVHCWGRPYATLGERSDAILPALFQVGDMLFVAYHFFHFSWLSTERGDPIDETLALLESRRVAIKRGTSAGVLSHMEIHRQLLRCLKGGTRARASLDEDNGFDVAASLAAASDAKLDIIVAYIHIASQMVCFVFGKHEKGLEHADAVVPLLGTLIASASEATFYFFRALSIAALEDPEARARRMPDLDASLAKLHDWAASCPENFESRHALIAAEVARLEGRDRDAMRLYEEAIQSAHDYGLVHNEAIALERAATYYRRLGVGRMAEGHLREARARYASWGASDKVAELEERFPEIFPAPPASGRFHIVGANPSATFTARTDAFDLGTVVEALQTISGTIVRDDLVRTLLRIVLEQGGAQRSVLLLADASSRPEVAAEASSMDDDGVTRGLPQSILDYVWRTGTRVLLDDAAARTRFSADPYIVEARPRSVLCLPVVRQARTVGLVYLENRLVDSAFTESRLSVLELLAAQAAISLENATLYANLERENLERTSAERATAASEERFRLLVDGVKDSALFMLDCDGRIASWNAGAERLFHFVDSEVLGQHADVLCAMDSVTETLALAAREGSFGRDSACFRKDRSRFEADVVCTALQDEHGTVTSYSVLVRDRSQRVKLEEQLRQAQKMEAVGRLAGGVAHDFNNLLAAIYGFVHRGLKRLPPGSPVAVDLAEIEAAGRKAGELTKQLLAFARKQRVEARVFDLGELVVRAQTLLGRLLGDDIELTTVAAKGPAPVEADPGQIEQVLLNLAVNARDAMPRGGTVTLELSSAELSAEYASRHADVSPGPFVVLAISDTGSGMTEDVLAHLFEPFFTTKGPAEGTGLGLATSYGIVKQAGGHIWVYSEPGRGTTFKIYLPRSAKAATRARLPSAPPPPAKGETVLLVEDHVNLRKLVAEGLESTGYRVLSAANGGDALALADGHAGPIELLITDLVMPKMDGLELAAKLEPARPAMKVLCVSGYTEASLTGDRRPGPRIHFLSKPFTPDELAKKIRVILDGE